MAKTVIWSHNVLPGPVVVGTSVVPGLSVVVGTSVVPGLSVVVGTSVVPEMSVVVGTVGESVVVGFWVVGAAVEENTQSQVPDSSPTAAIPNLVKRTIIVFSTSSLRIKKALYVKT